DGGAALVQRAVDERAEQVFQLGPRERAADVNAAVRQVQGELGRVGIGEGDLGPLRPVTQVLEQLRVAVRRVGLQVGGDDAHDGPVEVVAAEAGVAVGAQDLEHAAGDRQDRAVERAAAEVVDGDG